MKLGYTYRVRNASKVLRSSPLGIGRLREPTLSYFNIHQLLAKWVIAVDLVLGSCFRARNLDLSDSGGIASVEGL